MRTLIVGATGSRKQPRPHQVTSMMDWILQNKEYIKEAHHGDCIGWDFAFHKAIANHSAEIEIHIHPPKYPKYRSFAQLYPHAENKIVVHEEKEYLERNDDIVQVAETMICGPKDLNRTKSGTWYTIRKAVEAKKQLIIFM